MKSLLGYRNAKVPTIGSGQIAAGTIVNADVNASAAIALSKLAATTVSRALVSSAGGVISPATTTATEIGYVNGVTSAIQTQIDAKASTAYADAKVADSINNGTTTIAPSQNAVFDALALKQDILNPGLAKISGGALQWGVPNAVFTAANTQAMVADEDRYLPLVVDFPITISAHQFEVTTGPASDANVRIGIYAADNEMQPSGAALYDSGSIAVATAFTGLKTTSSLSIVLPAGSYLFVINCSVAMTLRSVLMPVKVILSAMGSSPFGRRFTVSRAYAAFPNPGTKWTAASSSGSGMETSVVFQWA